MEADERLEQKAVEAEGPYCKLALHDKGPYMALGWLDRRSKMAQTEDSGAVEDKFLADKLAHHRVDLEGLTDVALQVVLLWRTLGQEETLK